MLKAQRIEHHSVTGQAWTRGSIPILAAFATKPCYITRRPFTIVQTLQPTSTAVKTRHTRSRTGKHNERPKSTPMPTHPYVTFNGASFHGPAITFPISRPTPSNLDILSRSAPANQSLPRLDIITALVSFRRRGMHSCETAAEEAEAQTE